MIRVAQIKDSNGKVLFEKEVDTPEFWSDTATSIFANKYMKQDEKSALEVFDRVSSTIAKWANEDGVFDIADTYAFKNELFRIQLNQLAAFNSPVYFNVGVFDVPQTSACFILSVDDSLDSIVNLLNTETKVYSRGSGTGVNASRLRHRNAPLSGGGIASGPVSFAQGHDAWGGTIKSGGKTRRTARMVVLDSDHNDILEFIRTKAEIEDAAAALVRSGFEPSHAYSLLPHQNTNYSVMIDDYTMVDASCNCNSILDEIAQAAWRCGDPAVLFKDTINNQHIKDLGLEIRSANPCGEFLFIDNSACNLASINLQKVRDNKELVSIACTMAIAQDILIDHSMYPTEEIRNNSVKWRPIGLGITGLAAMLMDSCIAYGSDAGRKVASKKMELVDAGARKASTFLAKKLGTNLNSTLRNAQLTVVAPTGTISFVMDAESTGIEPVSSLSTTKKMCDGGVLTIVPKCVQSVVEKYGYDKHSSLLQTMLGDNQVSPEDQIKMIAALQKHVSGGISKTINLRNDCTPDDIRDIFVEAWLAGCKGITVYRDGSKSYQPLTVTDNNISTPDNMFSVCGMCGGKTKKAGTCNVCTECGETTGCG